MYMQDTMTKTKDGFKSEECIDNEVLLLTLVDQGKGVGWVRHAPFHMVAPQSPCHPLAPPPSPVFPGTVSNTHFAAT